MTAAINAMFKAVGCDSVVPTTQDDYYQFVFEMQNDMPTPIAPSLSADSRGSPHKHQRTVPAAPLAAPDPANAAAAPPINTAVRRLDFDLSATPPLSAVSSLAVAPSSLVLPPSSAPAPSQSVPSVGGSSHVHAGVKRTHAESKPAVSNAEPDSSQRLFAMYCAKLSVVQLFSDDHDPKHKPGCAKNNTKECRFNAPHKAALASDVKLGKWQQTAGREGDRVGTSFCLDLFF
jgi:hypothetical protein